MRVILFCLLIALSHPLAAETETPMPIRVGVLQFGTVNWELAVMQTHGLAAQAGLEVSVVPMGSKNAVNVALQGKAVDMIVSDWIWVSRQRAQQQPYTFVPYSRTVGALMVDPTQKINQLSDLKGRKLGIAGGPVDKSWLLFRAYARQTLNQDLTQLVEPVFGAPPLLNQLMQRGELPAVINFWHYNARLQAAGMQPLMQVEAILSALGVTTEVPLLGWVFSETWANEHQAAIRAFIQASYAAKAILNTSDTEWQRIQPLTKAEDEATLIALRDGYRAGIPQAFGAEEQAAAAQVFAILAKEGGSELVGASPTLSPGTFWDGFDAGVLQ